MTAPIGQAAEAAALHKVVKHASDSGSNLIEGVVFHVVKIAEFCDPVTRKIAEGCVRNFLRARQNAPMETMDAEYLRDFMRGLIVRLKKEGRIESPTQWCRLAGLPESTLRMFVKKDPKNRTQSMTMERYIALARAAGISVAEMIGEGVPRSDAERIILQMFRAMNDDDRAALLHEARDALAAHNKAPTTSDEQT